MIGLAWRFVRLQKDSPLVKWFELRTANARGSRKTMIVALARKLLIALWGLVARRARSHSTTPLSPDFLGL